MDYGIEGGGAVFRLQHCKCYFIFMEYQKGLGNNGFRSSECMHAWMDGWMDAWMDGCRCGCVYISI